MVNDYSYVFLDSVCKNFIEHFCINIHEENWSEVLFVGSLCGLGISVTVTSQNALGSIPSVSILWNTLRIIGIRPSLKV